MQSVWRLIIFHDTDNRWRGREGKIRNSKCYDLEVSYFLVQSLDMKIWICKRNTPHKHCKRKWFLKSDYPWVKSDKETDRFMMNSCTMILWVYIITTLSPFCLCLSILICHDVQAPTHWHTIRQASYFTATARLLYIKAALPISNSVISGSPGREFRSVSTVVHEDHVISKVIRPTIVPRSFPLKQPFSH